MGYKKLVVTKSNGEKIYGNEWTIEKEKVKANIMIVHGMAEHSLRYERFAKYLNSLGFNVYALDEPGHGQNVSEVKNPKYGYGVWPQNGFDIAVEQVHEEALYIRKLSTKKLFVFGHSMGSFITQRYYQLYSEDVDGVIICGSASNNLTYRFSNVLTNVMNVFIPEKRKFNPSKFITSVQTKAFNSGLKKFPDGYDSASKWISFNEENVKKYDLDKECGFMCSFNFFFSLFKGLQQTFKKSNLKGIKNKLPVLIISGIADPVGGNGKYIRNLEKIYKSNQDDVKMILYPNMRHEILNEDGYEKVHQDIGEFLTKLL